MVLCVIRFGSRPYCRISCTSSVTYNELEEYSRHSEQKHESFCSIDCKSYNCCKFDSKCENLPARRLAHLFISYTAVHDGVKSHESWSDALERTVFRLAKENTT